MVKIRKSSTSVLGGGRLPVRVKDHRVELQPYPIHQSDERDGVEIVASIEELLEKSDYILLETNDGTVHLSRRSRCSNTAKGNPFLSTAYSRHACKPLPFFNWPRSITYPSSPRRECVSPRISSYTER